MYVYQRRLRNQFLIQNITILESFNGVLLLNVDFKKKCNHFRAWYGKALNDITFSRMLENPLYAYVILLKRSNSKITHQHNSLDFARRSK